MPNFDFFWEVSSSADRSSVDALLSRYVIHVGEFSDGARKRCPTLDQQEAIRDHEGRYRAYRGWWRSW